MMTHKQYRTILIAILAAASARADLITFTASATNTQVSNSAGPGVTTINFSGELALPQFDPALGVLNGLHYTLFAAHQVHWHIEGFLPEASAYYHDIISDTSIELLGQSGGGAAMTPAYGGCAASYGLAVDNPLCTDMNSRTSIGYSGFFLGSSLQQPQSGLTCFLCPFPVRGTGLMPLGTARDADLSGFIGTDFLSAPIYNPVSVFNLNHYSQVWATGQNSMTWNIMLDYNYTPAIPVTATPEPRWVGFALLGLLLIGARLRRNIRTTIAS